MAGIYDEINKIKREGSEYDDKLNQGEIPADLMEHFAPSILRQSPGTLSKNLISNDVGFIGDRVDPSFGKSKYDKNINWGTLTSGDRSLEDIRAEKQPWYSQLTNNLINAGTIATTTFADSFVGTLAGVINTIANPELDYNEGEDKLGWGEKRLNDFVNNPVSIWLNSINKYVKDKMPTYTSDKYRENRENGQWYKNVFSGDGMSAFWGETLIENSGFMMGMVLSGKLSGSLINRIANTAGKFNIVEQGVKEAIKAGKFTGTVEEGILKSLMGKFPTDAMPANLSSAVNSIRNTNATNRLVSSLISTMGEARLEGIRSSEEFQEEKLAMLHSTEGQMELAEKTIYKMFSENPEMFEYSPLEGDPLQSVKPEYLEAVQAKVKEYSDEAEEAIKSASARIAGFDFALNIPALMASNWWQFGRTFTGEYATNRGFRRSFKEALRGKSDMRLPGADRIKGELGKQTVDKANKFGKIARIMSNPIIEGNEEMMQEAAQSAATIYAETLMGAHLNPDEEVNTINRWNAIYQGILDTYSDVASYEEFAAGFIMGAFGAPNITMSKGADGKISAFDGGIWGDIKQARAEDADLQKAIEAANARVNSENFQAIYKNDVAHSFFNSMKEEALDNGDEVAFENADHSQFIQDLITFASIGKTSEFLDYIKDNIKIYSETDPAKVEELALELLELGETENGANVFAENNSSSQDVVNSVLEYNKALLEKAEEYLELSNNLKEILGDKFENDDEMSEMIQLFSQSKLSEKQYEKYHTSLREKINNIKSSVILDTKFEILLQGEKQELNLVEIVNTLSPEEFVSWLTGLVESDFNGDFNYVQALFKSNEQKINEIANLENQIFELRDKYIATKKESTATRGNKRRRKKEANKKDPKVEAKLKEIIEESDRIKRTITSIYSALETNIERDNIVKDLNNMLKVESNRMLLTNTYNSYINNVNLLGEKRQKELDDTEERRDVINNEDAINRLRNTNTIKEVRDVIAQLNTEGNKNIPKVLRQMGVKDNEEFHSVVAEYNRLESLTPEIESHYPNMQLREGDSEEISKLWDIIKSNSNSVEDALNYNITENELNELGSSLNNLTSEEREDIGNKLREILDNIKKKNTSAEKIKAPGTVNTEHVSKNVNSQFQGDKNDSRRYPIEEAPDDMYETPITMVDWDPSPPAKKSTGSISEVKIIRREVPAQKNVPPPIKDTIEKVSKDNTSQEEVTVDRRSWIPSLMEIDINEYNATGHFKWNGGIFKKAVEFLRDRGAWDYLNKGKLAKGDKIYLVADESYWDAVTTDNWNAREHKPLLWVKKDDNGTSEFNMDDSNQRFQIVGVFNPKNNVPGLVDAVSNNPNTVSEDYSSTVNEVKDGRVEASKDNSYGLLSEAMSEEVDILFGISKMPGSPLHTNTPNIEIRPLSTEIDDKGRLYVLIPGAAGRYIPMGLMVKTLRQALKSNSTFSGTPLFDAIREVLRKGIINTIKEGVERGDKIDDINGQIASQIGELQQLLWIGLDAGIVLDAYKVTTDGVQIPYLSIKKKREGNTNESVRYVELTVENAEMNVLSALADMGVRFQIDANQVNKKFNRNNRLNYNDVLIESDILYSNIKSTQVRGVNFGIDPIIKDAGSYQSVAPVESKPVSPQVSPANNVNPVGTPDRSSVNYNGVRYSLNNDTNAIEFWDNNGWSPVNISTKQGINDRNIALALLRVKGSSPEYIAENSFTYEEMLEWFPPTKNVFNEGTGIILSPNAILYKSKLRGKISYRIITPNTDKLAFDAFYNGVNNRRETNEVTPEPTYTEQATPPEISQASEVSETVPEVSVASVLADRRRRNNSRRLAGLHNAQAKEANKSELSNKDNVPLQDIIKDNKDFQDENCPGTIKR